MVVVGSCGGTKKSTSASPSSYPVFPPFLNVINECFMKNLRPASCWKFSSLLLLLLLKKVGSARLTESNIHLISQKTQPKAFYSSRPGCRSNGVRLIHFLLTNFNISSVFGIKDTLLSYNPSGLHSQTPRPRAAEGLAEPRKKRKGKIVEDYSRDRVAKPIKQH